MSDPDRTQESYDDNLGALPVQGGAVHEDALASGDQPTSPEGDAAQAASDEALARDDVANPTTLHDDGAQSAPAMAQNNASEVDKIAGIVAQTRQDVGTGSTAEAQRILAQRFQQSGIDLPESAIAELATQVTGA